ncbi:MAG: hypothetical protein KJZ75_15115 [Hyphomonadaceae bacterium]|nr:hypothetical protein [Hyphomonadaceae bacterium]GIK50745.1 MAG: hypothetical protein BroJett013_34420 [Alphaproteobacteria bacterium]
MRTLALAAVMGAGLVCAAGTAAAEPFNDPQGRITFEAPRGWTVERQNATNQTVVLMFNASNDCYIFSVPNPSSANASPSAVVRSASTPVATESWTNTANSISDFFPNQSAQLVSQSVDASGFWPIQRAELTNGSRSVFGALTLRPGFDLIAFCAATRGGSASDYDALFRSLGHANDGQWEAQASTQPSPAN